MSRYEKSFRLEGVSAALALAWFALTVSIGSWVVLSTLARWLSL